MKSQLAHSPTLESVVMVEEAVERHSGECGKYQLWKRLPRKMMYQTFLVVLAYLERSNKLVIDKAGKLVWIWNPSLVRRLQKEGLISQ